MEKQKPDLTEGTRVLVNGTLRGTIMSIVEDTQPVYFVRLDNEKAPDGWEEPYGRKALQPLSLLDLMAEAANEAGPDQAR